MNRNGYFKALLWGMGSALFLTKIPYMFNAWQNSPLDRWDWIFVVAFCGFWLLTGKKIWLASTVLNYNFFSFVFIGICIYFAGIIYSVNAFSIIGGIICWWGCFGVASGGRAALLTLPIWGVLTLACTSSSYWVEFFIGMDGLLVKMVVGGCLLTAAALLMIFNKKISIQSVCFSLFCTIFLLAYIFFSYRLEIFPPYALRLDVNVLGEFIGDDVDISASDRFFFGNSDIKRAFFADKENTYAVLRVSDFEDIHKVHPAGHCMRTGGRNVVADRQILTAINGTDMQFNEVVVDNGNGSYMLILAWYGNKSGSTGSFIGFRKNYSSSDQWIMWQTAINYRDISAEEARERLKRFLITFKDNRAVTE